uniref:CID domain-containing protein n=1 Tax=Odontella aurita TaxID=265563 RepID=A0A7S4IRH3_9STRA|mmetsp:Transcript_29061/g.86007  ORF Transcript_29061/g.86007 Transcript_29061/m.86007 type:complete len:456 (+) Transcript_29061:100-1467(+)
MGDVRATLSRLDMSAPAIQSSAAAMMRLYDSPGGASRAVDEWRDVLRTCRPDQLLPLLYVANEVLQTSKRNRGNKFLEAFGASLGGSLRFICERDGRVVEKVRRTVKIWGDRRVYSPRFVGEILSGLEEFREGGRSTAPKAAAEKKAEPASPKAAAASAEREGKAHEEEDDDDDDEFASPFADSGSAPHLTLDIGASLAAAKMSNSSAAPSASGAGVGGGSGAKRRRSSNSPTPQSVAPGRRDSDASASAKRKKKATVLGTASLVELLERISSLSSRHNLASGSVRSVDPRHLDSDPSSLDDVVGDDLVDLSRGCDGAIRTVLQKRAELRRCAEGRREAETEAVRYLPWLREALRTDDDDLEWIDGLASSLEALKKSGTHARARKERELSRDKEAREAAEEEARRRKEEEEAERRRSLESVQRSSTVDGEGMVWNPATREYQYQRDETMAESWRD